MSRCYCLLLCLLMHFLGASGRAEESEQVLGMLENLEAKTLTVLTAPKAEVEKVWGWHPGNDDLVSLKKAIEIGAPLARDEAAKKGSKDPYPNLAGAYWEVVAGQWILEIGWSFTPGAGDRPGGIPPKDGDIVVRVYLLPNGAPINTTERPMTHQERVDRGLEEMTEKEKEDSRTKASPDPFAPRRAK